MTITRDHVSVEKPAAEDKTDRKVSEEEEDFEIIRRNSPIFVELRRTLPNSPCRVFDAVEKNKFRGRRCPPVASLIAILERKEDEKRRRDENAISRDGILAVSAPHLVYTHPKTSTTTSSSSSPSWAPVDHHPSTLNEAIDKCMLGKEGKLRR